MIRCMNQRLLYERYLEANAQGERGFYDKAASGYREILPLIELDTELFHAARHNLAWYEFREGNLLSGFLGRIESGRALGFIITAKHIYAGPRLASETDVRGKTILLSCECGAGDEILAARYAENLKARGASKIIWVSRNGLESVLSRVPGIDRAIAHEESLEVSFDYWALTLELPLILKVTVSDIERPQPYIFPNPRYVEKWRERIPESHNVKIGIRWKGQASRDASQARAVPFHALEEIVVRSGVDAYSLQRDEGSEDVPLGSRVRNLGDGLLTWEDTVAAISELDIVISTCTSIAHLASAMGKETWVLVRPFCYFAWASKDDRHSYWYGSARVFREPLMGNWEVPLIALRFELDSLLSRSYVGVPLFNKNDREVARAVFPHAEFDMVIPRYRELASEIIRRQGWYSKKDLALYDAFLSPGDLFVDAGAHLGWYSLYAERRVGKGGKVLAVEPDPFLLELLGDTIRLNASSVEVVPMALGDTDQDIGRLYRSPWNFGDQFTGKAELADSFGRESVEIFSTTLDTLLKDRGLPLRMIKIDVQGAEPRVLSGMKNLLSRGPKPIMILEFSPGLILRGGGSPFEIFGVIEKYGYRVFRVGDDYSNTPLIRELSVEELLGFTSRARSSDEGWDLLLVDRTNVRDQELCQKLLKI